MYWDSNDERSDELEPLSEYNVPFVTFRGLRETVIVADQSGPAEGLLRRTGRVLSEGVLELIRPILPGAIKDKAPTAFTTISLKEFLEKHPHPKAKTPYCRDHTLGTNTADWSQGAPFCNFCRDRLALVTALELSPAVRVVPVRS